MNATYQDLYINQLQLLKFRDDYPIIAKIHEPFQKSVMRYEKFNAIPIKFLHDKINELIAEHALHEDGQPLYESARGNNLHVAGRENIKSAYNNHMGMSPVFKSAENARAFNDEWVKIMQTPCKITL